MKRAAALTLLLLLLAVVPDAQAAWSVWLEPSTIKVLPDRAAVERTSLRFAAAGNEWEGYQIVVRAEGESLAGVDVTFSDLVGAGGDVIAIDRARVYREHLIDIENTSNCFVPGCGGYPDEVQRLPGRYPDPLIPFVDPYDEAHPAVGAPFAVADGDSIAVFVDVYVPVDVAPGSYEGTATVSAEGKAPVELSVTLERWAFSLPEERRVATAFGVGRDEFREFHGGPNAEDELPVEILRNYDWELRRHHIDQTRIRGPLPDFRFDDEGQLIAPDWSAFDAEVGPRLDGDYWYDGRPPVRWDPHEFRPGSGLKGMSEDEYAQAAAAFAEHLQAKGWLDSAWIYATDEPFLPDHAHAYAQIPADTAVLHSKTDLWRGRILCTTPYDERLDGAVDIWCPVTPMYGETFWTGMGYGGRDFYAERLAMGEDLWFYVCNANWTGWAGYDIDSPLGHEPRVVKWGAYQERATGFLYWRVTYWFSDDPWHDVARIEHFGDAYARNGDGILIYPGDHDGTLAPGGSPEGVSLDGPVLSYRLKVVRDGLEDWEMFLVAEELGLADFVHDQIARSFTAFGAHPEGFVDGQSPWDLDGAHLLEVRDDIAAMMNYTVAPENYPDPNASQPEPVAEAVAEPAPVAEPVADVQPAVDVPAAVDVPGTPGTPGNDGGASSCSASERSSVPLTLLLLLVGLVVVRRRVASLRA